MTYLYYPSNSSNTIYADLTRFGDYYDYNSSVAAFSNLPQYPIYPPRVYTPSPTPPPGLGFMKNQYGKTFLVDTLRRIILANNGIIFGNFVANEILYEYQKKKVCESKHKQRTGENIRTIGNKIDILVRMKDYQNMMDEFKSHLESCYSLNIKDHYIIDNPNDPKENTNIYNINVIFKINPFIGIGGEITYEYFQLVIYVDCNIVTIPETKLGLPLGILTYQHEYIALNNDGYSTLYNYPVSNQESVTLSDASKSLLQYEIIVCIQKGIRVFLPHIHEEEIWLNIKKYKKNVISNTISMDSLLDSLYFDYMITPKTKLDYFLEIVGSKANISKCSQCSIEISTGEVCCVTKCCKLRMHTSCMLEYYMSENKPTFNCEKCKINRPDKLGKNSSILLGF